MNEEAKLQPKVRIGESSQQQRKWIEAKAQLKSDVCIYFFSHGADRETVKKACVEIRLQGESLVGAARMFGDGWDEWEPINSDDIETFSPQHREAVARFINRYASLYAESEAYLESQRFWSHENCWARDDFEYEDWLASCPSGEIQVHPALIKVFAFDFVAGFAASLPRVGKQGIGKTANGGYEWQYPLSSLAALKAIRLPVLYAIDYLPVGI